jgi:hypothetical protein
LKCAANKYYSSETSILTRAKRRHISEDGNIQQKFFLGLRSYSENGGRIILRNMYRHGTDYTVSHVLVFVAVQNPNVAIVTGCHDMNWIILAQENVLRGGGVHELSTYTTLSFFTGLMLLSALSHRSKGPESCSKGAWFESRHRVSLLRCW